MSKPLIYVAGPYTNPDPVENTRNAFEWGLHIYKMTHAPVIVPHLTLLGHAMFPHPVGFWYAFDIAQVEKCDAVFRLPGASTGADREAAFALEKGLPVFTHWPYLKEFIEEWEGK